MALSISSLSIKMSLAERVVVIALLVTTLLSTFSGWLFQLYTDTICHQKLMLTFLLSTVFWVSMSRYAPKYEQLLNIRRTTLIKDLLKSAGIGSVVVVANQVLILVGIGLFFKLMYNCEVFGGWSQELIINNITANVFSFGLILSLVQWNIFQQNKARQSHRDINGLDPSRSIWFKDYNEKTRLPIKDIIWIQADNNCIHVHCTQRKFVVYRSLKSLEAELGSTQFVRIHRSKIVNRDYIVKIKSHPSGDGNLLLTTGEELRYSRTFKGALLF